MARPGGIGDFGLNRVRQSLSAFPVIPGPPVPPPKPGRDPSRRFSGLSGPVLSSQPSAVSYPGYSMTPAAPQAPAAEAPRTPGTDLVLYRGGGQVVPQVSGLSPQGGGAGPQAPGTALELYRGGTPAVRPDMTPAVRSPRFPVPSDQPPGGNPQAAPLGGRAPRDWRTDAPAAWETTKNLFRGAYLPHFRSEEARRVIYSGQDPNYIATQQIRIQHEYNSPPPIWGNVPGSSRGRPPGQQPGPSASMGGAEAHPPLQTPQPLQAPQQPFQSPGGGPTPTPSRPGPDPMFASNTGVGFGDTHSQATGVNWGSHHARATRGVPMPPISRPQGIVNRQRNV